MQPKSNRGGARPNSGPKPSLKPRKVIVSTVIDPDLKEWLIEKAGSERGAVSSFIGSLLLQAREKEQENER